MVGNEVKKELDKGVDPFQFKSNDDFNEDEPLIIMTGPGMLQNGWSWELFENWCTDDKNGIIFTGYSVDGTLAKKVIDKPAWIEAKGIEVDLKMSVDVISFSAHCDFKQTSYFIKQIKPQNIVLVHGDTNEMGKLKT